MSNRTIVTEDRRGNYYAQRVRECGPQYAGFDLLSAEVTISFLYTHDVLSQILNRLLAEHRLSRSTLNILMLLRHGPAEGMQLHDLGELLLVSRANITGLMDHLEEKGYVKRIVDPEDRRARYARITKKAEALLDQFMPVYYRFLKQLLRDLSEGEKESLIRLFRKTRASLFASAEQYPEETPGDISTLR
ncbi:MAG: MarR family transcriptional regulator [Acidobacteriaceae bacterium]|nr:MarR family transcriptional regulator [Acidobacteriaceae bacterium]MBV8573178.1 MarR family transcriptional regulator [Acidobacteriaceae bacterium]